MLSTIVEQGTLATRASHLQTIINSSPTELLHLSATPTSIGIAPIHALQTTLSITPVLPRLVWIEEAQLLTLPASNALLKLLEEPPSRTHFYLTCPYATNLLPTIRSRCQVIALPNPAPLLTPQLPLLKSAMAGTAGERLLLAQTFPSDKTQALAQLSSLLTEIHTLLMRTSSPPSRLLLSKIARLVSQAHTQILANTNVSLALGNLFLHLPKSK